MISVDICTSGALADERRGVDSNSACWRDTGIFSNNRIIIGLIKNVVKMGLVERIS